jgi:hypothetical protein
MLCDAGVNLADYIHTTPVCSRCLLHHSSLFLAIMLTIEDSNRAHVAEILGLDVIISLRPNEAIVLFSARLCLMLPNSFSSISSHEVRMVGLICSIINVVVEC